MATSLHINIHGIVNICFEDINPWEKEFTKGIADLISLVNKCVPAKINLFIYYNNNFDVSGMRQLGDKVFVKEGALFDAKYRVMINKTENISIESDNPCLEWFIWALQLVLLQSEATFVHGAALERDGRAILFPSWGGVGKTALVNGFVKERGWKYLGDDLSIMSSNGTLFGFPKSMVIYPYHKEVFPEIFCGGRGPVSPEYLNNIFTSVGIRIKPFLRKVPWILQFARRHNPQSVQINPSEVFGFSNLTEKAEIDSIIWLNRKNGISRPEFTTPSEEILSRIMGSTLLEFDPRCVRLTYIAMGIGLVDVDTFFTAWINILKQAMQKKSQFMLSLPDEMPVNLVPDVVYKVLVAHGVIK